MLKVLFLIWSLGGRGAEKVLVNLVNHLSREKFQITMIALLGGGINEQFLEKDVRFKTVLPRAYWGSSKVMKLLTPEQLHRLCVREKYDIEVSFLEGGTARVVSGCKNPDTKLISWIHVEQHSMHTLAKCFRSPEEAIACYDRFDQTICVSEAVKNDFCGILNFKNPCSVLYNPMDCKCILAEAQEAVNFKQDDTISLVAVGAFKRSKGYDRLLRIVKRLRKEQYPIHLYILGTGILENKLKRFVRKNGMTEAVTFLGYQTNPYKYISKCDLFVCASRAEGFSTAASESLILGTPVCTVEVSGMREMLGDSEYGLITENSEEALYQGIKKLLDEPELLKHYRKQAEVRGACFSTEKAVQAVEEMLENLYGG